MTNATVHVRPDQTIEHGTVVVRDGRIEAVLPGQGDRAAEPPAGARVWDCTGLHIYPGFIDAYVEVEAPKADPNQPGVHWNARVTPQRSALDGTGVDEKTAESLRKLGFAAAAISPQGGIFRGRSAVVSLGKAAGDLSADRPPVYSLNAYHALGFDLGRVRGIRPVGGPPDQGPDVARWSQYPDSEMGVIALMRQTFLDEEWQQGARKAGQNLAYNAIDTLSPEWARNAPDRTVAAAKVGEAGSLEPMPLLFDCEDELESLRAAKVAREFKRPAILLGSGYEFRRLGAIKADGLPVVLPLRYPRTPDVSTIGKAESVELRELMTWEQAPTNARRLDAAGVKVALTTARLRNRTEFSENLTKALKHGLKPERALAMLTTQPAEILGVSDRLGTIEKGKVANLVVADGDLFEAWPKKEITRRRGGAEGEKAEEKRGAEAAKTEPKPPAGEGQQPGGKEGQPEVKPETGAQPEAKGTGETPVPPGPSGRGDRDEEKKEVKRAKVRDVWIDGARHEINAAPAMKLEGEWAVTLDPGPPGARLSIDDKNAITVHLGDKKTKARNVAIIDNRLSLLVDDSELGLEGTSIVSGVVEGDTMYGTGLDQDGKPFKWTAKRSAPGEPESASGGKKAGGPAIVGEYLATETDGNPHDPLDPATPLINIKDEKTVAVTMRGRTVEADDVAVAGDRIDFAIDGSQIGEQGMVVVRATRDGDRLAGTAVMADGTRHEFVAKRTPGAPPEAAGHAQGLAGGRSGRDDPAGGTKKKDAEQEERELIAAVPQALGYPFGPYMLEQQPEQPEVLRIVNATIWTEGPQGVIENGEIVLEKGRISYVGPARPTFLSRADPVQINAEGRHITPGLIDCHSHTGISRGVNESGQAVTAEVRIQDVTDPDSISWYRQLAAGVTAVNNLHGSANAIGGQNCVNKNRWGVTHPDQMHFEGAIPGIKFALGENPKQSNWGDRSTVRYPQTRMGVEAIIRDRFEAAKEYIEQRATYGLREPEEKLTPGIHSTRRSLTGPRANRNEGPGATAKAEPNAVASTLDASRAYGAELAADAAARTKKVEGSFTVSSHDWAIKYNWGTPNIPPRRDLELEALAEILEGKRLVHCHSYRQDEILMLCRVADDFGFKIGTFQHILEGYKVADEVAKHAIGGSCFSDWWAYKVEVQDAIPYAGPIMHEQGVVVSFNSDSDELARRMNWEAAKGVKYGNGLKPEEALKFVTLNPAKQLMIDQRVGSLENGKDADLVIWSGPPLSAFSRCEATYVDGRRLFSLEDDAKHREKIASERRRIIQKLLTLAKSGRGGDSSEGGREGGRPGSGPRPGDDVESLRQFYLDLLNRGGNPDSTRPGECGIVGE